MVSWSFLSSHARVLLCIARDPGARLRDIAASVGITERSAHAKETLTAGLDRLGYASATSRPRSSPIFTRTTSAASPNSSHADVVVSQAEWDTLSSPLPAAARADAPPH